MVSVLVVGVEDEELDHDRRQADYVIELGETIYFPLEPGMRLVAEPGPDDDSIILRWKNPNPK